MPGAAEADRRACRAERPVATQRHGGPKAACSFPTDSGHKACHQVAAGSAGEAGSRAVAPTTATAPDSEIAAPDQGFERKPIQADGRGDQHGGTRGDPR